MSSLYCKLRCLYPESHSSRRNNRPKSEHQRSGGEVDQNKTGQPQFLSAETQSQERESQEEIIPGSGGDQRGRDKSVRDPGVLIRTKHSPQDSTGNST
jgi:hypothetical protein